MTVSGTAGPAFLASTNADVAVSAGRSLARSLRLHLNYSRLDYYWRGPLAFFGFAMQAKRQNSKPCSGPL